jgi:hypothetical protein
MTRSGFQAESEIRGDDEEDTRLLRQMVTEARNYVSGFHWTPPITQVSMACGVGGIVAIFLVEFTRKIEDTDDVLWVVVGDLPSAYLVVNDDDSPEQAMERYLRLMEEWARTATDGRSIQECFPVDADPTFDNATALLSRIAMIRAEIMPHLFDQLTGGHPEA